MEIKSLFSTIPAEMAVPGSPILVSQNGTDCFDSPKSLTHREKDIILLNNDTDRFAGKLDKYEAKYSILQTLIST